MNRREIVKAAIEHRETPRVPYCINFTPDGEERLKEVIGERSAKEFVDNDVIQVNAPWWSWHELGPEWRQMDAPQTRSTVTGRGSYEEFFDSLKRYRDNMQVKGIADELGRPANSVYVTLSRIRKRLQECITRAEAAEGEAG